MPDIHIIRALQRGLQVLEALNEQNGAIVSEVARATMLPRTTTFRLLENLRIAGYVRRDQDDCYRVTIKVRTLAKAFEDNAWIEQIVTPILERVSSELLWPIYVSTLLGSKMQIRSTTTYESPLAIDTLSPGTMVPLLSSGGGKVYLAFCEQDERAYILRTLNSSDELCDGKIMIESDFEVDCEKIRSLGYALDRRAKMKKNPEMTTSIAVPILEKDHIIASLTLRYTDSAMLLSRAVERFVPVLNKIATEIGSVIDGSDSDDIR